jgi:myo-inositol-1(or 4)-monophosphatase
MSLPQTDISRMLEVAIVAARLAGQRAMEEIKYIKYSIKNDEEIVTQADSHCQRIIIERIKENYPDHGFIAEEGPNGKLLTQQPRTTESIWWVIDPIDGSNNFAHRMPLFAVSIAAMHEGRPVVGVIFEPASESMFTVSQTSDAQLNASKITASDEGISRFASFAVNSDFTHEHAKPVNELMVRTRARNLGTTALHLAYVANGALIGTLTSTTKLWDFAAGALLAQKAGAIVTDLKGNDIFPVDLEKYTGQTYRLLAANKKTHPELLKIFASLNPDK